MYTDMDWWTRIRLEVLRGETSKREILRREGIHWETLKKIVEHCEPPGYQLKQPRPKPKIGPYLERIAQILEDDKAKIPMGLFYKHSRPRYTDNIPQLDGPLYEKKRHTDTAQLFNEFY